MRLGKPSFSGISCQSTDPQINVMQTHGKVASKSVELAFQQPPVRGGLQPLQCASTFFSICRPPISPLVQPKPRSAAIFARFQTAANIGQRSSRNRATQWSSPALALLNLRTCEPAHLRTCAPAHLRTGMARQAPQRQAFGQSQLPARLQLDTSSAPISSDTFRAGRQRHQMFARVVRKIPIKNRFTRVLAGVRMVVKQGVIA